MNRFVKALLLVVIFSGCEEENPPGVRVLSLTTLNDERSALSARATVVLSTPAQVYIRYWPQDSNPENAKVTILSATGNEHTLPLYLLNEQTTYNVEVLNAQHKPLFIDGNTTHHFTTAAIPNGLKTFYSEADNQINDNTNGYYLFHNMAKPSYTCLVDNKGKIVWYRINTSMVKAARFTSRHTLLTLQDENDNPFGDGNLVMETTLAGDTLFIARKGEMGFDQMAHHDVQLDNKGQVVVVTNVYKDGKPGDGIIVLNRQGQKVWAWDTFREITEIDPATYVQPWMNSITIDQDNHYIVSFRALCQVWKINSTTGEVMWRLGKNGNVSIPGDGAFLFQHFAHRNKDGDIMLFDNGSASRPQSRALSFSINETSREAAVKINAFLPGTLYSAIMGSAAFLPDGNILSASAVNGTVVKMDPSGNVLWKLKASSWIYRVEYVSNPFE